MEDRANAALHKAAFIPTPQTACPIVAGEAGLWNNGTALLLRNVDGTDTQVSAMKFLGFTGHSGAGACTLTGAALGDVVVGVVDLAGGTASSEFEASISVAAQIQQSSATDLSTHHFAVLLQSVG